MSAYMHAYPYLLLKVEWKQVYNRKDVAALLCKHNEQQ